MLAFSALSDYSGPVLARGERFLYIPPHPLLSPFVSHYCISFPTPGVMSADYTVLPSASSTLVTTCEGGRISSYLRCVASSPTVVGRDARQRELMLLTEFRPGGLYPFLGQPLDELRDLRLEAVTLDRPLCSRIETAFIFTVRVEELISRVNGILLSRLSDDTTDRLVTHVMRRVIETHGAVRMEELAGSCAYSERQLRRLFLNRVGVTPKQLSRMVRSSYALELFRSGSSWTRAAADAGFFDQPHLISDFHDLYGLTPGKLENLSDFYNEAFKL